MWHTIGMPAFFTCFKGDNKFTRALFIQSNLGKSYLYAIFSGYHRNFYNLLFYFVYRHIGPLSATGIKQHIRISMYAFQYYIYIYNINN